MDGFVLVRGDRIEAVGAREDAPVDADERLDASGCIVVPAWSTCLNHSVTATDDAAVEASLVPVAEMGMRQVFAKEVRPDPLEEQLALAEAVHRRWNGEADGRTSSRGAWACASAPTSPGARCLATTAT